MSAETIRLSDRLELVPRGNTVGYYLRRDGALTGHTVGTATADALIAACNPPTLPPHTFRLPDGELACYRRDAAKLREAGATLRTMTGITPAADYDRHHPDQVLLVEFPAPPETKRVHWVVALRGQLPLTHNSGPITSYIARPDARATNPVGIDLGPEGDGDNRCVCPDALGKVEVLASDGAL